MKVFSDTSVLFAALVRVHPMHGQALLWLKRAKMGDYDLFVSAHSLAELYSNLTGRARPRISAGEAQRLVHESVAALAKIVSLSPSDYLTTLRHVADLGLTGGIVYDALIARAAQKAGADKLVTFNPDHFRRVWPEGEAVITMA